MGVAGGWTLCPHTYQRLQLHGPSAYAPHFVEESSRLLLGQNAGFLLCQSRGSHWGIAAARAGQSNTVSHTWAEGTSANDGPSWFQKMANSVRHGHPDGYFVGSKPWTEVLESEPKRELQRVKSAYGTVSVYECGNFRVLETGGTLHSVAHTGAGGEIRVDELVIGYIRVMVSAAAGFGALGRVLLPGNAQSQDVACLGIGGGSLPVFLSSRMPGDFIHAVDIDPLVVSCACRFMGLPSDAQNLRIIVEDAARFMNERCEAVQQGLCKPFSAIFLDVYGSDCTIPSQFATANFLRVCRNALLPGGTLIVNLLNGETGSARRTSMASFVLEALTTFEQVFTIRVNGMPQNVILVALHPLGSNVRGATWDPRGDVKTGGTASSATATEQEETWEQRRAAQPSINSSEGGHNINADVEATSTGNMAGHCDINGQPGFEPGHSIAQASRNCAGNSSNADAGHDAMSNKMGSMAAHGDSGQPGVEPGTDELSNAPHVKIGEDSGKWLSDSDGDESCVMCSGRAVRARARAVGQNISAAFDMGDELGHVFMVELEATMLEGFVEVRV